MYDCSTLRLQPCLQIAIETTGNSFHKFLISQLSMYILNYSSWNIILFQNSSSKTQHLQSYTQAIQTICYMLYLLVPSRETVALKNKIEKQRLYWIIPVFGWSLSGVPYRTQVFLIIIYCFRNIILLPIKYTSAYDTSAQGCAYLIF